jgi:20S proteasome subunit alpha 2
MKAASLLRKIAQDRSPGQQHSRSRAWQIVILSGTLLSRYLTLSLTTFSPSGKLAQIEYALAAVGQGLPSLGIRCSNGVVLASEKPHSSILTDQSSFEKISRITPDAGVVYAGMGPDFRVLVDKARKAAHAVASQLTWLTKNYLKIYNEYPPTRILVQDVAKVMQEATHSGYHLV